MKTKIFRRLMAVGVLCMTTTGATVAENAAAELEKGVQLQETEGDVEAAIRHFEAVLRADGKIEKLAAEARFRLAQCHLAKGNTKEARKQIEALQKDLPADNRWVQKAAALLPKETKFKGVPWIDGKAYRYSVRIPSGEEVGQFIAVTRKAEVDGQAAWEAFLVRAAGNYSLSQTKFLEASYAPVEARWYMRGMGDRKVLFGKDGIVRLIDGESGEVIDSFDAATVAGADSVLYENEELVQLMRALTLEVGTKQKTKLISPLNGAVPIQFDLEVTAHEEVEVPAGTYKCAKIETNLKQTFYIGLEDDHPLIKIEIGPAYVALLGSFDWDGATPAKATSEHLGCELAIPGPMIAMQAVDNEDVYRQQFWSTDFAGRDGLLEINWTRNLVDEAKGSSRACAEHMMKLAKKNYKEWGPVDGSWEEVEVGGVKGVGVRARGVQGTLTILEYHVYAQGEEKTVIFRMNYGPKEEKEARERTLELLKSLKWDE